MGSDDRLISGRIVTESTIHIDKINGGMRKSVEIIYNGTRCVLGVGDSYKILITSNILPQDDGEERRRDIGEKALQLAELIRG